jgi:hypothetical protein
MRYFLLSLTLSFCSYIALFSQKTYTENGGEIIFSFSDVEYQGNNIDSKMRLTMFLHMGRQRHYDFTNNIGMYSGLGLRNIGFSTDWGEYVEKRRTYSLGVPLALKIGSFNDHMYFTEGESMNFFFTINRNENPKMGKLNRESGLAVVRKGLCLLCFAGCSFLRE